jgi:17beta-estradiol 17-dehydrogenase / very-long-chain 3-oxoacyl-CoA reductase
MTSIVLPGMVAKKKGVILNISSASGKRPISLLSLYSGTKVGGGLFGAGLQTSCCLSDC